MNGSAKGTSAGQVQDEVAGVVQQGVGVGEGSGEERGTKAGHLCELPAEAEPSPTFVQWMDERKELRYLLNHVNLDT